MLIREIVNHCAPTLAHIKAGSLFAFPCPDERLLLRELSAARARLPADACLVPLRVSGGKALLYLYHTRLLEQALRHPQARTLLHTCDYHDLSASGAIAHLRARLAEGGGFPHEIGLFLGYPPADVIGFIRHNGQGCLCAGCWKVYANADAAQRRFQELRRCQAEYSRLYEAGVPLDRLASFSSPEYAHHSAAQS